MHGEQNRERMHHCHLTPDVFFLCSLRNKAYEQLAVLQSFAAFTISLKQLLYPKSLLSGSKLQILDVKACGGFPFGDLVHDQVSKHYFCPHSLSHTLSSPTYTLSLSLFPVCLVPFILQSGPDTLPKTQTGLNIAVEIHSHSLLKISSASEFRGIPISDQCLQDCVWYTCNINKHKSIISMVSRALSRR